jgi:inosine-uridine nucleoside N-ribohydrolase
MVLRMKPSPLSRRQFFRQTTILAAGLQFPARAATLTAQKPIPVILATDIGDDIDDSWALGFLLRCPELDLKLVYGEYGKSLYRAKLIAKFFQSVGRSDIPIAMGAETEPHGEGGIAEWIRDYDLKNYTGTIHRDAVTAIIDTINQAPEPVTVISIAPAPNLAAALRRDPHIAKRARLVGMYGSLRRGYDGSGNVSAEWNVKADVPSARVVFAAPWDKTITPLDTCGIVKLDGEHYRKVCNSSDPVARTVIENYRIWSHAANPNDNAPQTHSSTLFDTVAVYLALTQDACQMEILGVRITDDGFTRIDPNGDKINAATAWNNLDAFRDLLVARLTGAKPS